MNYLVTLLYLIFVVVLLWNTEATAAVTYESRCTAHALWKYATRACSGLQQHELDKIVNDVSLVTEKGNENYQHRGEAIIVAGEAWDESALKHLKQLFCNETTRMGGTTSTMRARLFSRASKMVAINEVIPTVWVAYSAGRPHHRQKVEIILRKLSFKRNQIDWVNFGEKEDAFTHRDWIAQHVFSDGLDNTSTEALTATYLSTFSAFRFLQNLANSTLQYGLYLEDDARPVFQFKEKFHALFRALESERHDWDIVFLGTCLNLHNTATSDSTRETYGMRHAKRNKGTRCFNAVMMKRHVARAVLRHGAWSKTYLPIDHLFNKIIEEQGLHSVWAQPPLFFEESKAVAVVC